MAKAVNSTGLACNLVSKKSTGEPLTASRADGIEDRISLAEAPFVPAFRLLGEINYLEDGTFGRGKRA